jgi:alpha-tubulin suppressor-like RCC1 family protein
VELSGLALSGATDVSVGDATACAVLGGGLVACWGNNYFGQLGANSSAPFSTVPVLLPNAILGVATRVSVGPGPACATNTAGEVWCWGYDAFGNLGDGSHVNSPAPVRVAEFP